VFYLVCFDIVDDRTRYRAVKILKGFGSRVQKSVFECPDLTEKRFLKLKLKLEDCIDHGEDSVRYYAICRDCLTKVECSGLGDLPNLENFVAV